MLDGKHPDMPVMVQLARYVELVVTEDKYERLVWYLQSQRSEEWNQVLELLGEETYEEDDEDDE